jgi:hypothetical protein
MRLAVFEGFNPNSFDFDGLVEDTLNAQVKSIRIQTAYGPDIFIPRPFEPSPPKAPGQKTAADYLKPRIEIQLGGGNPITWSPYGDPRPSKWPLIKYGAIGAVVLIVAAHAARRR